MSFLSFAVGGAAGTALTPMPLKLMDDSSIWTQMWPWIPVPQDGEVSYENSVCTLCPGHCGITVKKVENRVVKIEGMKGHPVNDGGICLLGLAGVQLLYGSRRVKTPLKKVNGKFVKISWDEAVTEVASTIETMREKGDAHKIGCLSGTNRGTVPELLKRLLWVCGSLNFFHMPSVQDSYEITLRMMQGGSAMAGFDLENSDHVISFGSGILDGWGSPVRMFRAHSLWREKGARFIQVESRLSNTAAKADKWVPVNPGTEGALALGIAAVIIDESLYKTDFVDNYSSGFDSWKRQVTNNYTPEIVSKITGVDKSLILLTARDFGRAKNPLALCGRGEGSIPGSIKDFKAVHALNALVGNINQQGGVWAIPEPDYINWPEPTLDEAASAGVSKGRIDGAGKGKYRLAQSLFNRLPEIVNSKASSPPDVLFVSGANPLYTIPDTVAMNEALNNVKIISFSSYMDETADKADLILPNHVFLERYEDVPASAGLNQPITGLSKPVVSPQFNTRHVGDVIIQVAKKLGGHIGDAFPWSDYKTCLEETLGDKWEALNQTGFVTEADFNPTNDMSGFKTDSGRFEFLENGSVAEVLFSSVKPEGDEASYPLTLVPFDSMRLTGGYIGNPPYLMKTVEDTVLKGNDVLVEVNPKTASKYKLADGEKAFLMTPKGKACVKIYHYEGIKPGLIGLARGLGHNVNDRFLAGKGVNVNQLMGSKEDTGSGLDAAWGIRAKLVKA